MSKVAKKNTAAVAATKEAPAGDENKNPVKINEMAEDVAEAKKKRGRPAAKKDEEQQQFKPTENLMKNAESKTTTKQVAQKEEKPAAVEELAKNKRGGNGSKKAAASAKQVEELAQVPVIEEPAPEPAPASVENVAKKRGRKPSGAKPIEAAVIEKSPTLPASAEAEASTAAPKSLTITGQMFYNKDQKKSGTEVASSAETTADNLKATKKGGAQKKEKDPVEAKQDEETIAKKKPKGRQAKNAAEKDEETPAPKTTPPKTKEVETKTQESVPVTAEEGARKTRGRKPAAAK